MSTLSEEEPLVDDLSELERVFPVGGWVTEKFATVRLESGWRLFIKQREVPRGRRWRGQRQWVCVMTHSQKKLRVDAYGDTPRAALMNCLDKSNRHACAWCEVREDLGAMLNLVRE